MIAITPVVVQEMSPAELLELIVAKVGKQPDRVRRILRAGTLIRGASRYRWERWEPTPSELEELLTPFPEPEPQRPFRDELCSLVVIRFHSGQALEVEPEALSRRKMLKRSFWEVLCELMADSPPDYRDYSHQEKADRYRFRPDRAAAARIGEASDLLVHHQLAIRLRTQEVVAIDLFLPRASGRRPDG